LRQRFAQRCRRTVPGKYSQIFIFSCLLRFFTAFLPPFHRAPTQVPPLEENGPTTAVFGTHLFLSACSATFVDCPPFNPPSPDFFSPEPDKVKLRGWRENAWQFLFKSFFPMDYNPDSSSQRHLGFRSLLSLLFPRFSNHLFQGRPHFFSMVPQPLSRPLSDSLTTHSLQTRIQTLIHKRSTPKKKPTTAALP